ncbi:glyoxalase/bleomycin resistance/extradiol dioxygenase family protein [Exiguobacterium sp. SH0S1]|uniref:VOC family protein n=1 Tax=Exiguobacterium sp. SH0S1 TaxID=2510949 RepID=UPI001039B21D|nr:VOC family protein [Exiguobacterium sp. SH0S1]TCI80576.1 glyoxalase/bleomycin resistance/extradiol dioxygenase family protein [Exiguobacterium sp. SH0S1]
MNIEHVAVWVHDLERMRRFYETYFGASANDKYTNRHKQFTSYFLTFPESACRLELMSRSDIQGEAMPTLGWAHVAFALGSAEAVDELTARLQADGYELVDGPRLTGDGYYESVVHDPELNKIELTI